MSDETRTPVFVDYTRQLDIFDPSTFTDTITVIGVGGIGSPTTIVLAKMGCTRIVIYDPDTIELHNIPNQFYRIGDVGRPKVEALKDIVREFAGVEVTPHQELFAEQQIDPGIVIAATDSMTSRKAVWNRVKYNPHIRLFIDARMGGEVARIYAVNPSDIDAIEAYEKTLYDDSDASPEKCTAKAIMYNVFAIAAIIGDLVKKLAKGQALPSETLVDLSTISLFTK